MADWHEESRRKADAEARRAEAEKRTAEVALARMEALDVNEHSRLQASLATVHLWTGLLRLTVVTAALLAVALRLIALFG